MVCMKREQQTSIVSSEAMKDGKAIKTPFFNQKDILFGRGGESNKNNGNKRYLKIIDERSLVYGGLKGRKAKTRFAWDIYKQLSGEGARFLKHDSHGGKGWEVASPEACRKKISQRLRERALIAREATERAAQKTKLVLSANNADPTPPILPSSIVSGICLDEKQKYVKEADAEESSSVATAVPEPESLYSSDDSIEILAELMEGDPLQFQGADMHSFGLEPEPIASYGHYLVGVNTHPLGQDPLYARFSNTPHFAVWFS